MKTSIYNFRLFFSLLFVIILFSAKASDPIVVPLWQNNKAPVENQLPDSAEVVENEGWISFVTKPELFVYPAEHPNGKALLMCPGGGYAGVAISHEGKALADILNNEGITLAVLKYRMPNHHASVPSDDVHEAFKILEDNAKEWGINPKKIGIGGASAGGHLASTIATHPHENSISPAFQILLYPVISMKEGLTHKGSRDFLLGENPSAELVDYYSNELQVTPQTPPAFIVVSGNDNVVPVENSLLYFNSLKNNNVPVSLHVYPVGGHGWGVGSATFPYNDVWIQEMITWLSNQ